MKTWVYPDYNFCKKSVRNGHSVDVYIVIIFGKLKIVSPTEK
jgi:hypothetical protein